METRISRLSPEIGEQLSHMEIWIVEDHPALRESIVVQLSLEGFQSITEFPDGKPALEEMQRRIRDGKPLPALIITDYNMPIMDGENLIKELTVIFETQHISPHPSIIFHSFFQAPQLEMDLWKQRLQPFDVEAIIQKSASPELLITTAFETLLKKLGSD